MFNAHLIWKNLELLSKFRMVKHNLTLKTKFENEHWELVKKENEPKNMFIIQLNLNQNEI